MSAIVDTEDNKIDVDRLIDGWSYEARLEVLAALINNTSISCVQLDKATSTRCLIICGKVPAKTSSVLVSRSPIRMTSCKLVILEPSFEKIERESSVETICAKIQTTKTWWGSKTSSIIEPQKTVSRTVEHKTTITVPRSIWRLRGMFVGSDCALPLAMPVSGDLFGPGSDMRIGARCEAGLDVTLMIENTTEQEMPFHAVVLGIRA